MDWYEIEYRTEYNKFVWSARIECAYGSLSHYVRLAVKDWMLDHLPWRKRHRKGDSSLIWQVRLEGEWIEAHRIKVTRLYGNIKDYAS